MRSRHYNPRLQAESVGRVIPTRTTLLVIVGLALVIALAVPAVATAADVDVSGWSSSDIWVSTDDHIYLRAGWADAYKPQAVYQASRWIEFEFSVYPSGGTPPLYPLTTSDGAWGEVMGPYESDPDDPNDLGFWHPRWPHEWYVIYWRYDVGFLEAGDYQVSFDSWYARSLLSWWDIDLDGHPDLVTDGSMFNEFIIHVVDE